MQIADVADVTDSLPGGPLLNTYKYLAREMGECEKKRSNLWWTCEHILKLLLLVSL